MLNIITLAFLFKKDQDAVKEAIKLANKNKLLIVKIAITIEQKDVIVKKQCKLGALRKIHNFVKQLYASS